MSQQTAPVITAPKAYNRFTKGRLRVGTIAGYPVFLHWTLLILLLVLLMEGLFAVVPILKIIAIILLVVLIHEAAHAAAAQYFGFGKGSITLTSAGGFFIPYQIDTPPYLMEKSKRMRWMFVILAGPIINLLLGAVCYLIFLPTQLPFFLGFAQINLTLGIVNLLPIYPLDGGQAVTTSASLYFKPLTIYTIFLILLGVLLVGLIFIPELWPGDERYSSILCTVVPLGIIALLIQVVKSNDDINNDWLKAVREERQAVEGE